MSAACRSERALDPMRQRITEFQLKEQAARLGSAQYAAAAGRSRCRFGRRWRSPSCEGNVQLHGLQGGN